MNVNMSSCSVNCYVLLGWLFPKAFRQIWLVSDHFDNFATGKKGHKGRGKQFSNPEEIDRQMKAQREMVSDWEMFTVDMVSPPSDQV